MRNVLRMLPPASACLLLALEAGTSAGAEVRFHYVPADAAGNSRLEPAAPGPGAGERIRWFGLVREVYAGQPRPTHLVTFRHPYSGRPIAVPISFPDGAPRIEHVGPRLIYDYGSYTITVRFLTDGSVDLIYSNGLLRRF
jgi:hypothetical protein